MNISIRETILMDRSTVFDVFVGTEYIPAATEQDAHDLAVKIAEAINAHSTIVASVEC
jgi:hypothetical protein